MLSSVAVEPWVYCYIRNLVKVMSYELEKARMMSIVEYRFLPDLVRLVRLILEGEQ